MDNKWLHDLFNLMVLFAHFSHKKKKKKKDNLFSTVVFVELL